jgi:hypothetical protein
MGRLGGRTPLYGPLSSVVLRQDATRWLETLLSFGITSPEIAGAIVQIAARTGDPLRDLDPAVVGIACTRLLEAGIARDSLRPLEEIVTTSIEDANRVFGEPLPAGLRLADA